MDHARDLVPLGDLDPVEAVSLTDAGPTSHHAVKPALPRLVPGATAVVIGAGGLGHVGIQSVRALSAATVIALDIADDKLEPARAALSYGSLVVRYAARQARSAVNGSVSRPYDSVAARGRAWHRGWRPTTTPTVVG